LKGRIITAIVFAICMLSAGMSLGQTSSLDTGIAVSLNFEETPISSVLRMLAAQNNFNLVVSANVEGEITITLDKVTLAAALNAILIPNGYNYHIVNDIVIVKDADRLMAGEIPARPYRLKYIDAATALAAIQPLLSDKGQAVIVAPKEASAKIGDARHSSQIMVSDYPAVHQAVNNLLPEIDSPRRQVSVEVKIIETNLARDEKLGINWPKSVAASINGVSKPGSSLEGETEDGSEAAVMPLEDGNWQLGYLSVHQMDMVLDFLQSRNNSKLLSNPRLTAMEGETATIQIQTVIPIQTINRFSEGAIIQDIVTFQDEEVGISLKVTPYINDDSTITMQVNPIVEEIVGYTGTTENQKPITSQRAVSTKVTMGNNQTIALGGLLKETKIEKEDKVLFLGSIPLLGKLFTNKSTENKTTDLLILITPRIMD